MILVTGANGQLGFELRRILGETAAYLDVPEFDFTNLDQVTAAVKKLQPKLVINCAAYTAVDKAETEATLARQINVTGPAHLAKLGAEMHFRMIHLSTDYVFDGTSRTPYKEDDPVHPQNIYGQTKADSEKAILKIMPSALIVRTSWLYSTHGHNFVKTVLRLSQEKKEMRVVSDQIGSLTSARDLAEAILKAQNLSGIYHYSNDGFGSWYDVASEIKRIRQFSMMVTPIPTTEYPTQAKRPLYSVFNKEKIKTALHLKIPLWQESLEKCLREIS